MKTTIKDIKTVQKRPLTPTLVFKARALLQFCLATEVTLMTLPAHLQIKPLKVLKEHSFESYPCICGQKNFESENVWRMHFRGAHPIQHRLSQYLRQAPSFGEVKFEELVAQDRPAAIQQGQFGRIENLCALLKEISRADVGNFT